MAQVSARERNDPSWSARRSDKFAQRAKVGCVLLSFTVQD